MRTYRFLFVIVGLLIAALLTGCGTETDPFASLPAMLDNYSHDVRASYHYALTHPEMLDNMPCYCGCDVMGHESNLACYVERHNADGTVLLDPHGLNCRICNDIALDTQRLSAEGWTEYEIRQYIDANYQQYGAPTITDYPPAT